jgi:hypothetical protein
MSGTPCIEHGAPLWLVKRMPPTTAAPFTCHDPLASTWNAVHGGVPGGTAGCAAPGAGWGGVSTHGTAPGVGVNADSSAAVDTGVVGGCEPADTDAPGLRRLPRDEFDVEAYAATVTVAAATNAIAMNTRWRRR